MTHGGDEREGAKREQEGKVEGERTNGSVKVVEVRLGLESVVEADGGVGRAGSRQRM